MLITPSLKDQLGLCCPNCILRNGARHSTTRLLRLHIAQSRLNQHPGSFHAGLPRGFRTALWRAQTTRAVGSSQWHGGGGLHRTRHSSTHQGLSKHRLRVRMAQRSFHSEEQRYQKGQVVHTCKPTTWEAEAGGSQIPG